MKQIKDKFVEQCDVAKKKNEPNVSTRFMMDFCVDSCLPLPIKDLQPIVDMNVTEIANFEDHVMSLFSTCEEVIRSCLLAERSAEHPDGLWVGTPAYQEAFKTLWGCSIMV